MLKYLEKDLPQGSEAWLSLRKRHITATMASVIAGNSPFQTPDKLWKELLGIIPPQASNFAMERGKRLEPVARKLYEERFKEALTPCCLLSEKYLDDNGETWIWASLDGLDDFGIKGVEIKCPGEKTHLLALNGVVPDYYQDQVQWQYLASENQIQLIDYVSFNPDFPKDQQLIVVPVAPDLARQAILLDMAKAFRTCLANKIPPCGSEFEAAAKLFVLASREADLANEKLVIAKKLVIDAAKGQSQQGSGVIVSVSDRKGSVDWDGVIEDLILEFNLSKDRIDDIKASRIGASKQIISVKAANDANRVYEQILMDQAKQSSEVIAQVLDPEKAIAQTPEIAPVW